MLGGTDQSQACLVTAPDKGTYIYGVGRLSDELAAYVKSQSRIMDETDLMRAFGPLLGGDLSNGFPADAHLTALEKLLLDDSSNHQ